MNLNTRKELKDIKKWDSINALDFVGEKIKAEDLAKIVEMVKVSMGRDYDEKKFDLLWSLILEEGWTDVRFRETAKWFLKNKKWHNWTIADWFEYTIRVYSYSKYLENINIYGKSFNDEIEWYKIDGVPVWKYRDGIKLPFEKIGVKNGK